jgi:hypothetical protein
MKSSRRPAAVFCVLLAGACIGGCASRPTDHIVYVGPVQPAPSRIASLGAGDSLGQRIYANDAILAQTKSRDGSALATVTDDDEN